MPTTPTTTRPPPSHPALAAVLGEEALAGAVATLRALSGALDEIQPGV